MTSSMFEPTRGQKAVWTNGKKSITGNWIYYRHNDRFFISLDSKDPITGRRRELAVAGDHPEWGKWKLVRKEAGE